MSDGFLARLEEVQTRIARAAERSQRRAEDVTLVAVTKTHPAAMVEAAYAAGLRDFGENRIEGLRARHDLGLSEARWHMIGHIQSRKVKELVGICDVVHSVDRLSLAEALDKRLTSVSEEDVTKPLNILLQVNVSGEESKGGWRVTHRDEMESFKAEVAQVADLSTLRICGLMTMAPFYEAPDRTRPIFANLRRVLEQLQQSFPTLSITWLSMGMTNDYEIAIEEGATHVRIGTALFGERL